MSVLVVYILVVVRFNVAYDITSLHYCYAVEAFLFIVDIMLQDAARGIKSQIVMAICRGVRLNGVW